MSRKSGCFLAVLVAAAVLVGLAVFLAVLAVDREPAVTRVQTVESARSVRLRRLARDLRHKVLASTGAAVISVSEDDLNGLAAIGHRSLGWFNGEAEIREDRCALGASLRLPHTPLGDYLNLRLQIAASSTGLRVLQASVGDISVSGRTALAMADFALDRLLGPGQGEAVIGSVQAVELGEGTVTVRIARLPELRAGLRSAKKRLKNARDTMAPLGDPEEISIYYQRLVDVTAALPPERPVSLATYLEPLFRLAHEREGRAAGQNRSAILALAIYLGHWRFEQLTGTVRDADARSKEPPRPPVRLAGREDLRLHFLVSAGLKIASESRFTHAIGELKELLDAGHGGSGFSFVDLAADRAGVRFAEVATDGRHAWRFQRLMVEQPGEDNFFPDVLKLPEGLPDEVFRRSFGSIESDLYKNLVRDIDRCIDRLPAYRPFAGQKPATTPAGPATCDMSALVPPEILAAYPAFPGKQVSRQKGRIRTRVKRRIERTTGSGTASRRSAGKGTAPSAEMGPGAAEVSTKSAGNPEKQRQIARLQARLDKALLKYTEMHPEVLRLRNQLRALKGNP